MFGKTSNELVRCKDVYIGTESFYAVSCFDSLTSSGEESWFFDSGSRLSTDGLD